MMIWHNFSFTSLMITLYLLFQKPQGDVSMLQIKNQVAKLMETQHSVTVQAIIVTLPQV